MIFKTIFKWLFATLFIAFFIIFLFWLIGTINKPVSYTTANPIIIIATTTPALPVFAPKNLTWTLATSTQWEPRDSQSSFVFNNKIWLGLGLQSTCKQTPDYEQAKYFKDLWSSTDGTNWQKENDLPFGPRRSMPIVEFKGKLIGAGGWTPDKRNMNDIWESADGKNWQKIINQASWPARESHQLVVYKNKLWLIGGVNYDTGKKFNDVWNSDDGITWTEITKEAPWAGRWDHAISIFKDQIWLMGGMNSGTKDFGDVWNTSDGKNWQLIASSTPWGKKQGAVTLVYKNYLWLLSGMNLASDLTKAETWYSADGIDWQKTDKHSEMLNREDHTAVVFKNKLIILGGMTFDYCWTNEVWISN